MLFWMYERWMVEVHAITYWSISRPTVNIGEVFDWSYLPCPSMTSHRPYHPALQLNAFTLVAAFLLAMQPKHLIAGQRSPLSLRPVEYERSVVGCSYRASFKHYAFGG